MTHWPNSLLFLSSSLYTHISFAYIVYITNFIIKRNSPLISTFTGFYFWFYTKYEITFTIQFFLFEMTMKMILFKAQPSCIITSLYFIYSWKFHQIYKKLFYKHTLKNEPYYCMKIHLTQFSVAQFYPRKENWWHTLALCDWLNEYLRSFEPLLLSS